MANNRIYANFLMHGRTKGSRNGVSTTKGYTAVGQKAKGKIINGRYVYDYYTPYGTKNSSMTEGYTPLAAISTKEQKRQEQVAKDNAKARENKMKAENAANVKSRAAAIDKKYGYKQMASQAASQEWRDKQERAKAEKAKADAAKNNWQYKANKTYGINTMLNKAATGESRSVNGSEFYDEYINNATYDRAMKKVGDNVVWAYKGPDANMNSAYNRLKAAREKTIAKGAANNWQQQAAYQQQKDAVRNRAAASAAKGAANDWQDKANVARAMTEYGRNAETVRNAKEAARSASVKKMKSKQANAMKGDPRYSIQYPKAASKGTSSYVAPNEKSSSKTLEEMRAAAAKENPAYASAMKLKNQQETFMGKNVALEDAKAESKIRNSRSDIGNAVADFKEEAKAKAKSLFKKKKKKK